MYCSKHTYGLAYRTGDPVETPLHQVGYVTSIEQYGVLVRIPIPGKVDPRCITPRASNDSLWVFDHQSVSKAASCVL
jgi:hypothetical protein